MEANQEYTNSWYKKIEKIVVGVRNDQMLKGTLLKFKLWISFGVDSNTRISGGGSNLIKKVPYTERLLS
jgi:hypothetical protein